MVLQWFSKKLARDSIGAAQPSHAGECYQTITTFSIRIGARESTHQQKGHPGAPSAESYITIFCLPQTIIDFLFKKN
jgi:hypothetical protein